MNSKYNMSNNSIYNNYINATKTESYNNSNSLFQNNSKLYSLNHIKPRFIRNLNEIISKSGQFIFNYLTIKEITLLRGINKLFYESVNDYYEIRLKIEINNITNFKNENEESTILYMQNIDSQIPVSYNQWLEFDLKKVTKNMELLDKETITELKSIKKLIKLNENIYAPFCIILGYKPSDFKVKMDGWKKVADSILNEPNLYLKIKNLDYENFKDADILKAFVYLNNNELSLNKMEKYSLPFSKLIKWCQAVVSYHILIHPYTFRNKASPIELGSEVHKYVLFMDEIISKFYKFKRFLFRLGLVQIPLGDYVFNLQHNKSYQKENLDLSKIINTEIMGNIISYLPMDKSYKLINVNHLGVNSFKQSLNINCYKIIKEIILFKLNSFKNLNQIIPLIYKNNIFGKYFLMLDDVLNSALDSSQYGTNFVPFLTKEHMNDIRNIKTNDQIINKICKIFCVLLNIKVEKKENQRGEIVPLYIKSVKLLATKGIIPKLMRYFDKFELNKKQLQILMNEINNLFENKKMIDLRRINKGIYQILIWELFLYEYLKEFNPFLFIDIKLFLKNIEKKEDVQIINYYLELINYLKYYLKFKYHFHSLNFSNKPEAPNYEFILMITKLFQELNNKKIDISPILDNLNIDKVKTANIYFENKDLVPINSKPALYQKIMEEIININENFYNELFYNENVLNKEEVFSLKQNINNSIENSNNVSNNLGIIKEENTMSVPIGDNSKIQSKGNDSNIKLSANEIFEENDNDYIKNYSNYYSNSIINKNIEKNNKLNINDIPNEIIAKNILLYLDIKSVCPFSSVNKKCNRCYKINMFLRLLILDNHKQIFENVNEEYINSIKTKRNNFFLDYEIAPPNKEHAIQLINQFKNKDITELRGIFRKYNKYNEILISPLVILLGEKPKKPSYINGQKKINYFSIAQKLLNDRKINKRIKEINLETIPNIIFKDVEKIFQNDAFSFNKMKGYTSCIYNLICWEMGVIEYHRVLRNFCLNYYDMKILTKEEIIFCRQMDNINIMYNKLKYYSYTYCKEYEKDAIKLMMEINQGIFEDTEQINVDKDKESNILNEDKEIKKDFNTNKNESKIQKNKKEINEFEDSIEDNNKFNNNIENENKKLI